MPKFAFICSILSVAMGSIAGWAGSVAETTGASDKASNPSFGIRKQAPEPTAVGIAYDTSPPPLASLTDAL